MKSFTHQAMLESLEARRLYSATAVSASKTIHAVGGESFTADLGKATPYSPAAAPSSVSSVGSKAKVSSQSITFKFTAIIHWGDGKTSAGIAVENSDGTYDIEGTHTYAKVGTYHLAVFVTRAPSGSGPLPQFIELYNSLHDRAIVSSPK